MPNARGAELADRPTAAEGEHDHVTTDEAGCGHLRPWGSSSAVGAADGAGPGRCRWRRERGMRGRRPDGDGRPAASRPRPHRRAARAGARHHDGAPGRLQGHRRSPEDRARGAAPGGDAGAGGRERDPRPGVGGIGGRSRLRDSPRAHPRAGLPGAHAGAAGQGQDAGGRAPEAPRGAHGAVQAGRGRQKQRRAGCQVPGAEVRCRVPGAGC